jgi:prolipoprotein diacylglyceryltransferase
MILNFIHWKPDPEIVNIFGISIRYYGLLFVSGLIIAIYMLRWIFKRESVPAENLEKLIIYGNYWNNCWSTTWTLLFL